VVGGFVGVNYKAERKKGREEERVRVGGGKGRVGGIEWGEERGGKKKYNRGEDHPERGCK
jgi:hypothetical protein